MEREHADSLRLRHTTLAVVGVPVALSVALGLLAYDLTHSNRPHELRFVPWIAALAAVSVWLAGLAALELVRSARAGGSMRWRARAGLALACCGALPGLGLLTFALLALFES